MTSIYSIVGMKFQGAEKFLSQQRQGEYLRLIREPDNPADPLAIQVFIGERRVGYLKAAEGHPLANEMDSYGQTEIPARLSFAGRYPHAEVG